MVGAGFLRSCSAAKPSRFSPTALSPFSSIAGLVPDCLPHISPHLNYPLVETPLDLPDQRPISASLFLIYVNAVSSVKRSFSIRRLPLPLSLFAESQPRKITSVLL